jgi:hypothetical protein
MKFSNCFYLVKTNEQSMKGLDDYFRKTKAKPSIYWLQLTEEQVKIIHFFFEDIKFIIIII